MRTTSQIIDICDKDIEIRKGIQRKNSFKAAIENLICDEEWSFDNQQKLGR
jgi:hypothetical protein